MSNDPHSIGDILDRLGDLAEERDAVRISDVVESMGTRSYGPFLLVPALLEITPIGGIPGVPTFFAIIIAIFAVQIVFGRKHLWLPGFLGRQSVSSQKVTDAADKLRGFARTMDRLFHGRMVWLTRGIAPRLAALVILVLCATVPPLELVPFASTAPMAVIAAFGLALLVGDGLLMAIAFASSLAALGLAGSFWSGGESAG